ncbi:hypothetical protein AGDE_16574 [Angomonas deanei]|uniref:Emp24/gp25L/p24 family/GOLD, putative n=1 Tax=Angomonas deanei TaxID=59799 RepID=A0A7G2C8L4_9TRYP|nr:hypothetical protein AGDE_16574 [Angomonas deanei]CAD2214352.1 emp24/gp25L/p24 family/GOLD, putative [Angomonas deanei]|eukprot:EPY16861.1 hypothetical protein AGDE_16574 [Angomonas deanei]
MHFNMLQLFPDWSERNRRVMEELGAGREVELLFTVQGASSAEDDEMLVRAAGTEKERKKIRKEIRNRKRKEIVVQRRYIKKVYTSTEDPMDPDTARSATGMQEEFIQIPPGLSYSQYKFCFSVVRPAGLVTLNKGKGPVKRLYIDLHVDDPRSPSYINTDGLLENRFGGNTNDPNLNNNANRINVRDPTGTGPDKQVYQFTDEFGNQREILESPYYLQILEMELKQTKDKLMEAKASVATIRAASAESRSTMESTFTRIWVCAILVTVILSLLTWGQYTYLKRTIRRRRM